MTALQLVLGAKVQVETWNFKKVCLQEMRTHIDSLGSRRDMPCARFEIVGEFSVAPGLDTDCVYVV